MSSGSSTSQEQMLGGLLGMSIGDAMGMPVAGWSSQKIAERFGRIDSYHLKILDDGAEIKAGEFTDESETVLCIVESFTANQGVLDPDNIGARLIFLGRGESKRWMGRDTLEALDRAERSGSFQAPLDEDGPATGDVAARGIAIGLSAALAPLDPARLTSESELVTRLTHGSPLAIAATTAVAYAVQLAARRETPPDRWLSSVAQFIGIGAMAETASRAADLLDRSVPFPDAVRELGDGIEAPALVSTAIYAAATADTFEDAVFNAVNAGGATDARGAIAGAIAGVSRGAGGIPQWLIDELEGRIYVSLAAPWFYRIAKRRSGPTIELRSE